MGKKVKKLKNKTLLVGKGEKTKKSAENSLLNGASQTNTASSEVPSDELPSREITKGPSYKYSVEQLLSKAEDCVDSFDYELAVKFCRRALDLNPEDVTALEMMGFLRLQTGDPENAQSLFSKAIELAPDTGHSKYMYMGQVSTGLEAIQFYNKGIQLVKNVLESVTQSKGAAAAAESNDSKLEVTNKDVSSAYCAIAEIYLTDACFEEDAETKCKDSIDSALSIDPTNTEAYQLLTSFWLCKEDRKLAGEALEKGLTLWLPQLRDLHSSDDNDSLIDPVQICPVTYTVRVSYSKTAIELENYEVAEEILGYLMLEDNQVVEVWYLLGWLNYLRGDTFLSSARYHLTKGQELAVKSGCEDQQIVEHMTDLLSELGPATESDLEDANEKIVSDSEDEDEIGEEADQEENMHH